MDMTISRTVPDHVPDHLVVDIDYYDVPGNDRDPQAAWKAFKGRGPLVYSPYNGGHWVATCGKDVFRFFGDFHNFSSSSVVIPDAGDTLLPVEADPPVHGDYRAAIAASLTPAAVAALAPAVRQLTIDLIEEFRQQGECEFVSQFALQLPLSIFLKMVNLPQDDRLQLRHMVEEYEASPDIAVKQAAFQRLIAYLDRWIEERIAHPGDDAITRITQEQVAGRPFTREEMLSSCVTLFHGGLATVTSVLSFMTLHLAQTPEHRRYIRENPDDAHNVIQEFLRRYSVNNLGRVVTNDMVYKDVALKKGDRILLCPSLFNLDEDIFEEPESIDFARGGRHITFGSGRHTCAGALLARRELTIFLEEWLSRIPDFALDPARPPRVKGGPTNGVVELWLKWEKPGASPANGATAS